MNAHELLRPYLVEVALDPPEAGVEQAGPGDLAFLREAGERQIPSLLRGRLGKGEEEAQIARLRLELEELKDFDIEQPGVVQQRFADPAETTVVGDRPDDALDEPRAGGRSQSPARISARTSIHPM